MTAATTKTKPVIGYIDLPAGTIHVANYETAAWHTTFEHPAQRVEVRLSGNFALYSIEGRTTHEHFPTLFGGVATGGGTSGPCDRPGKHHVQFYGYTAAAMAEAGELELAEGYEIRESFFDHPVSCSGYSIESQDGKAVYVACDHDVHEDAHYRPTITERSTRGFLPFGYVPGLKNRKRHIKIVKSEPVLADGMYEFRPEVQS